MKNRAHFGTQLLPIKVTMYQTVHIKWRLQISQLRQIKIRKEDESLQSKIKWSRYRPSVVQRVGRGIALLIHDRGTRKGWVVSSTPRPHFTLGKDSVPILQEAGWASGPVWTGGKSRPHRESIPDRPGRSQSLYWLSYPTHYFQSK